MTKYSTRAEAIAREIVEPIEGTGVVADAYAEYDIAEIAEDVLGGYEQGFACIVPEDEFWECVRRHALSYPGPLHAE